MKRNRHPQRPVSVDSVTPFERSRSKPAPSNADSASAAVQRGSLGIHFDSGGQYLAAQKNIPLAFGQRLQVELNGLLDI